MKDVLFVDDERGFIELGEQFLEKHSEEIDVESTTSPRKALELIKENDFDCVVCDYQMPDVNGLELLEKLKKDKDMDLSFIVFTGKGGEEVAMKALNKGADRYLKKRGDPSSQFSVLEKAIKQEAERKELKENIKEEKLKRKVLIDNFPGYALILKKGSREIVLANEAAKEDGAEPGKTCYETIAERENQCPFCRAPELWETEERQEIKAEYRGKNYHGIWVPFTEDLYIHYIFDITEQKEKEKELIEAREEYKELIDGMNDTAWVIDFEGNLREVNQAAVEKLGYNREELLSMKPQDIDVGLEPREITELRKNMSENEVQVFETKHETKDGKKIPVEISSSLINYKGEPAILSVGRDISKRKEAEEREKFLHSLLRHDVRNKSQIVLGYLDLIDDYNLPDEVEEYVSKAGKATKEGIYVIEKIRTLREVEEQEETKEVDLNSVLKEVVNETEEQAKEKGIKIKSPNCDCKVKGGPLLNELFYNIIENSIKHSKGNTIRIKTKQKEDKCIVRVEDDGKGIPDEKKDKVFERGFKDQASGGSGLGMYLAKKITENYNENIETKDSELGGARFDVYLQKP